MKRLRRMTALALTLAMVLTVGATAASAYSSDAYSKYAPDDTMEVDENILSGSTAAANTTALSFLGINVTSTDVPGVLNAYSDVDNPVNLLVFGSEVNENPDPYLWNFYYNYNKDGGTYPNKSEDEDDNVDEDENENENEDEDKKDVYEKNSYANWKGAYTLLNDAKEGPSGSATEDSDWTTDIDVNGVCKTCNPLFFYEPDILFGGNEGAYTYGLTNYHTVNANYTPLELYGWTMNDIALNDRSFASTAAMANGVYNWAKEIQDYIDNEGDGDEDEDTNVDTEENDDQDEPGEEIKKGSRYNDGSVLQCGIDYSNFALGVYYYVQSRLNPNNSLVSSIPMAGYCTGVSISDTGVITVTNDNSLSGRYEQYMDGIAYQVPTETVYQDYGKLKDEVRLIIMDTSLLSDSQKRMLTQVNVKYVDINSIMPQTAYGTTMQSADNILGVPYFVGLLYEGRLSTYSTSLSEYDYTAYFIENLYHVENDKVETVLDVMVGDGCGSGYTGLNRSYNYNDLINSMIQIGAAYYKDEFLGSGLWQAVDDGLF